MTEYNRITVLLNNEQIKQSMITLQYLNNKGVGRNSFVSAMCNISKIHGISG